MAVGVEAESRDRFVEVAVPVPVDRFFDYALPAGMRAEPGVRVRVPHGGRQLVGVVVGLKDQIAPRLRSRVRPVAQVLDERPVLPARLLDVVLRAAEESLSAPGLALASAIPRGTAPRSGRRVLLLEAGRRALDRGQAPGTLGKVLWSLGRGPVSEARLKTRFPAALPALDRLERIGWIRRESTTEAPRVRVRTERVYGLAPGLDLGEWRERLRRAPRQLEILERLATRSLPLLRSSSLRALIAAGAVVSEDRERARDELPTPLGPSAGAPRLTPHQAEAVAEISDAIVTEREACFLLHGITGSGKTEVYLRASERALALGRGVIVLVPEISLTHQIVDRFRDRFGDKVAVLHSGLSPGDRFDQWRSIREGLHPIAIGARSAIFAPFERLGLIAIDEEHDGAYKSEEGFRYHARDVARLRARAQACPLVLGGATPDVETRYRAERGEIERLLLPERVASRPLPVVEIVDMQAPKNRAGRTLLSRPLRNALAETLASKQQAILLVNRRGFASRVYCFGCGHALHCKHCEISLVYHSSGGVRRPDMTEQGELRCHYCGYVEQPSATCPNCGSPEGALAGFGTERLQEQVSGMFPHARVARLDRDTSARKGAQREILRAFHRGETDVLVGTQMVAKGHDVPNVTLVGVVAADMGLHFPDYRASERTFQLLTQVAGRAGRGVDPGRVVLQTFVPDHYVIALARTHDYETFYREEIARRRPHGYPPFRSLLHLLLSSRDEVAVEEAAQEVAQLVALVPGLSEDSDRIEILGPAPAPIARIKDQFRWQLLVLGSREEILLIGRDLAAQARSRFPRVKLRLVPAPVQML